MKWLQQQRRVDSLARAARLNRAHLSLLGQRLSHRIRSRLQQPGSLAWAFSAGCLVGAARSPEKDPAETPNRATAMPALHYLNSLAIIFSLVTKLARVDTPPSSDLQP